MNQVNDAITVATQQKSPEVSISDELEGLLESLSLNQIRYAVARQTEIDKGAAALVCGLQPDTVYRWGPEVEEAVRLIARDTVITALHLQRRMIARAMAVKVAGLSSDNEHIRQACAAELLDRGLGKAVQRTDLKVSGVTFTIRPRGEG